MSKPQRKKAGVTTASSSQAAEFFSGVPAFITFDALDASCGVEDTDDIISLKKLAKKDSSTRERALRELLERTTLENCDAVLSVYSALAEMMDKLILDCEPVVRALSARLIGKQMKILSKKAEKQLKQVLPWLFFATCDCYPQASAESNSALSSNFPQKKDLALKVAMPALIQLLQEILVTGESPVLAVQKVLRNGEEEGEGERRNRLCDQSLLLLASLLKENPSPQLDDFLSHFAVTAYCKGNKELSRAFLRALLASPRASSILQTGLADNVLATLRSTDEESAVLAADACCLLLQQSPQKALQLQPRIISFVKSIKSSEWSRVGSRLLPLLASLCQNTSQHGRPSLLRSFFDSLSNCRPIPSPSPLFHHWADASIESVKLVIAVLSSVTNEERDIALSMVRDILDGLVGESESEQERVSASLLPWLFTPSRLPLHSSQSFAKQCILHLTNKLPGSSGLMRCVLSLHLDQMSSLWWGSDGMDGGCPLELLHSAPLPLLLQIHEHMNLLVRIESRESAALAPLYLRLLRALPPGTAYSSRLLPSPLSTALLTSTDSWELLSPRVDDVVFECALSSWAATASTTEAISLLSRLPSSRASPLFSYLLSLSPPPSALHFLAPITATLKISDEVEMAVANRLSVEVCNEECGEPVDGEALRLLKRLPEGILHSLLLQSVVNSETLTSRWQHTRLHALLSSGVTVVTAESVSLCTAETLKKVDFYLWEEAAVATAICPRDQREQEMQPQQNLQQLLAAATRIASFHLSLLGPFFLETAKTSSLPLLSLHSSVLCCIAVIHLARHSLLFYEDVPEEETLLLHEFDSWQQKQKAEGITECDVLDKWLVVCGEGLRQWLLHSLQYSSLPSPAPSAALHQHVRSQLLKGRPNDLILKDILRDMSEDDVTRGSLFTLGATEEVYQLSLLSFLTGTRILEGGGSLSGHASDFLFCGLLTALHSCDEDNLPEGGITAKWAEPRRTFLAAAAVQLAVRVQEAKGIGEEWASFFLPPYTELALKWWAESGRVYPSALLSRLLSLFLSTLPTSPCDECHGWGVEGMLEECSDQQGLQPATQALLLTAQAYLLADHSSTERVMASSVILSRHISILCEHELSCAVSLGESEWQPRPPSLLCRLIGRAETGSWAAVAVVAACVEGIERLEGEERVALSETLAALVAHSMTATVSRCQASNLECKPSAFISDVPLNSRLLLPSFAYRTFYRVCLALPSTVRMWYARLPKAAAASVFKFVNACVSGLVVAEEMSKVRQADLSKQFGTVDSAALVIRVSGSEVECEYSLEESRMRLRAQLPSGWPLLPAIIQVEGSLVGVDISRQWMLQLQAQLLRNASLAAALSRWLEHADRRVEKADACCICMALVAPVNKQLPKAKCRQCKNKFHSSCLYKWFESSSQSTCPLCRTDFTAPP